jgi:chromosome segregation ATPase
MINHICDNALLTAYGRSAKRVDCQIVKAAMEDGAVSAKPPETNLDERMDRLEQALQKLIGDKQDTTPTKREFRKLEKLNGELTSQVTHLSQRINQIESSEKAPAENEAIDELSERLRQAESSAQQAVEKTDRLDMFANQLAELDSKNDSLRETLQQLPTQSDQRRLSDEQAVNTKALQEIAERIHQIEQRIQNSAEQDDRFDKLASRLAELQIKDDSRSEKLQRLSAKIEEHQHSDDQAVTAKTLRELSERIQQIEQHIQNSAEQDDRLENLADQLADLKSKGDSLSQQFERLSAEIDRRPPADEPSRRTEALETLAQQLAELQRHVQTRDENSRRSEMDVAGRLEHLQAAHDRMVNRLDRISEEIQEHGPSTSLANWDDVIGEIRQQLGNIKQQAAEALEAGKTVTAQTKQLTTLERAFENLSTQVRDLHEMTSHGERLASDKTRQTLEQAEKACRRVSDLEEQLRALQDENAQAEPPGAKKLRMTANKLAAQIARAEERATHLIGQLGETSEKASVRMSRLAEQAQRAERMTGSVTRITEAANRKLRQLQDQALNIGLPNDATADGALENRLAAKGSHDVLKHLHLPAGANGANASEREPD